MNYTGTNRLLFDELNCLKHLRRKFGRRVSRCDFGDPCRVHYIRCPESVCEFLRGELHAAPDPEGRFLVVTDLPGDKFREETADPDDIAAIAAVIDAV